MASNASKQILTLFYVVYLICIKFWYNIIKICLYEIQIIYLWLVWPRTATETPCKSCSGLAQILRQLPIFLDPIICITFYDTLNENKRKLGPMSWSGSGCIRDASRQELMAGFEPNLAGVPFHAIFIGTMHFFHIMDFSKINCIVPLKH